MVGELILGLHLLTWHSAPGFRSETFGMYVRSPDGWTAGGYNNSIGARSLYIGKTFETESRRFALTAGVVTGYGRVMPMVVPSIRFDAGSFAVRAALIPPVPGRIGAAAVHFAIEKAL